MRTLRSRSRRLRASFLLIVAGVFALAATTAAALEQSAGRPIPGTAFGPVVIDTGSSGAPSILGAAAASSAPTWPTPSFDLRPLADAALPSAPPDRPQPPLPSPRRIVVEVAPPKPAHTIAGLASWYCNSDDPSGPYSICHYAYPDGPGFDAYGAAGPGLRAAIGSGWRNTVVSICGRTCVRVRLIDWCKCTGGSVGVEKLIDLYYDVYVRTGSKISISW